LTLLEPTLIILQWDEPFASVSGPMAGSTNDVDLLFLDVDRGGLLFGSFEQNIGGNPLEGGYFPAGTCDVVIAMSAGTNPPNLVKWIAYGDTIRDVDPPMTASTLVGQPNTPHTAAVGAAYDQQTFGSLTIQPYSAIGGTPIMFNRDGSRMAEPTVPKQPKFVGPDGYVCQVKLRDQVVAGSSSSIFLALNLIFDLSFVRSLFFSFLPCCSSLNSFFGPFVEDPAGIHSGYRFFGTSAAAPNVAAVALLVLQASRETASSLLPPALYEVLEQSAIDMSRDGFDYESGYGFVNAKAAINQVVVTTTTTTTTTGGTFVVPEYCDYTNTNMTATPASDVANDGGSSHNLRG
jgi:hypothetical protein